MAKNSMKPQIRFKGFTDAWEQRKVNSICEKTYGGGTPSTSDSEFWSGEIPWIQSSDIVEHNVLDVTVRKRISNKAICSSATQRIPANSIAIITRVGVGKLAFMPFSYTTSQDFLSLSGLRVNALFATYALYVKLQNDMNIVQGTSIKGITKEELLAKEIAVPICPLEQERICTLFKGLDNLITLHQRKYEKFVNIKKALLEKMFPQGDEKVPRIRFKGFTDAWEQRKFGEVFTYERPDRYIVASDKYSDYYSTPVLTANKGFILGYTNEQRTYNHPCVIFDDFTLDSKYVDFPFMVKSSALKILTAKQGYYLPFAYELLHAANIEVLGHARHYISVVQPTAVLVPNYPEQLRIGKFIEAIDNLITLHQRQVEKLKNIKSALLEKMFV